MRVDNDDNDSVEGAIARNLFRTDSDSSSSDSDDHNDQDDANNNNNKNQFLHEPSGVPNQQENESTVIQRKIGSVMIEERIVGGSIAHRLWPAAEYLAGFITGRLFLSQQHDSLTGDASHDDTNNLATNEGPSTIEKLNILQKLDLILKGDTTTTTPVVPIIEIGAGVGYTGLQLAVTLPASTVLLTDLEVGLELLNRNIELNRHSFRGGTESVVSQRLDWNVPEDCDHAIEKLKILIEKQQNLNQESPILIIGSDCVYWEELHAPLEKTLFKLLSRAPSGSLCLLAGMRRWKRDNNSEIVKKRQLSAS